MGLKNVARYDKGIVRGITQITEEGYIKSRSIVTRCGVFLYKNSDGSVRRELRHPDEVLKADSLETMKMVPVVNGHPPERLITADNSKRLAVGFTGEQVEIDQPYIIANLLITDKKTVDEIKSKKKNELSLGYTTDLVETPGNYYGEPYDYMQTNIRYNHLALVDTARAGPEARIALDGDDAEEITLINEDKMADKKGRKVKIDAEEYMLEDNAAMGVEGLKKSHEELMKKHQDLMGQHEMLKSELEKAHAERDSMRDKDYHDPEAVHHPMEQDEIGKNGKEEMDPVDSYGMQSHVKDYEKPTSMENHAVMSPKNEHYPKDLPHVAKVDAAEVNKRVKERVKLEKFAEKYLPKSLASRVDGMSDIDIKKNIIKTIQPKADLQGKNDVYINARFDSVLETLPSAKVIANPSNVNSDDIEKDQANADEARKAMIKRQKVMYKGGK